MFTVTYDITTYESAEHGDIEEGGFVLPGNWHVDVEAAMADKDGEYKMSLRDALQLIGCCEDGGRSFYETDGREDYRTGERETRALHPPSNITNASYARVRRLVCGK